MRVNGGLLFHFSVFHLFILYVSKKFKVDNVRATIVCNILKCAIKTFKNVKYIQRN